MSKFVLSPEAQLSLKQIKTYSIKQFGTARTNRYLNEILLAFRALVENPDMGRNRGELMPGYCSYCVGSHTIYYRIKPDLIEVIDVLHQSMEPTIFLPEP